MELVTVTQKIFGLVSPKKSKRRWFFSTKKKTQIDNSPKKENDPIKKVNQKSEDAANSSAGASDVKDMRKAIPLVESAGNPVMLDTPFDPELTNTEKTPAEPAESAQPLIEAFYFGSFRVLVNHQPIEDWPGKKGKSIFAYLLLNHKKKIFRDVLMDIFWPKSSPDSARNCLNVCIHGIRRALYDKDPKTEYILFKDECYYCNPEIDINIDVEEFRKTWRSAQSLEHAKNLPAATSKFERAARLYKGDFLEDEMYDSWNSLDRENLREIYLVILDRLSKFYIENGQVITANSLCEKIIQKDNCREDIHRRLMRCHYYSGQRFKAIRQFRKCKIILKNELEVAPDKKTVELYEQIKQGALKSKL
jgi:DNA-binding SARP family transcriptional activator